MKRIIVLVILAVVVLVGAWALYRFWLKEQAEKGLILYGNVDVRQVDIGFRVAGQVDALLFEEGDLVEKGKLMATLDKTPYISQHRQAQANREAYQESLENAERLVKRREELIGVQGVSQEDLDNARTNRNTLRANLAASVASVVVAHDNLSYTEVYAPNTGIILSRVREPGTVVNPADPVYILSLTTPVWVRAYVAEPDLGRICYGMEAEISTDTENGPTYRGKIGFISPLAEFTPKTVESTQLRTDLVYRLRIYIDHPDCQLKQGMPVTVRIKV